MGGSAEAPPPPDTSMFSDQSIADANMQREWAQSMWDRSSAQWNNISQSVSQYIGSALPAMEESFSWAREQRDNFNNYIMPQMQSLFSEAETYASQAEQERQRGAAIQDVSSAMEAQRASAQRKLDSYGTDPSVTAQAAMDRKAGVQEAAVKALVANNAGERTKQIGRDMRSEAIGLGSQFLQDASQASQLGSNIGGQAVTAGAQANLAGNQMMQGAMPFMQGAYNSNAQGAGIIDQAYNQELAYAEDQRAADAANNEMWSGAFQGGMNMMSGGLTGMSAAAAGGTGKGMGFLKGATGAFAAEGGEVQAPGGPTSDSGAIAISDGEYVVPADVVRRLGTNHFDKMIEKETGRPPPSVKQALPIGRGLK